jgi:hypothetical protein
MPADSELIRARPGSSSRLVWLEHRHAGMRPIVIVDGGLARGLVKRPFERSTGKASASRPLPRSGHGTFR